MTTVEFQKKFNHDIAYINLENGVYSFGFTDLKIADDFYIALKERGCKVDYLFNQKGEWPKVTLDINCLKEEGLFLSLSNILSEIDKWKEKVVRNSTKRAYCVEYPTEEFIKGLGQSTWQGCPGIAVTKNGRIFVSVYSGGPSEPHPDNYTYLIYSDDDGKTWSKPVFATFGSREDLVHTVDLQVATNSDGSLDIFWVQEDYLKNDKFINNYGCYFYDTEHAFFTVNVANPDADKLVFSKPKYISKGFMRNKPIELSNGEKIYFAYDQDSDRYGVTISSDGKDFKRIYGGKKLPSPFDETMGYELKDKSIRMLARTSVDYLAESYSFDGGYTWTDAVKTDVQNSNTRFYVGRTPSGKILLINNEGVNVPKDLRTNLTAYLSSDDGKTFKVKRLLDDRLAVAYPDVDYYEGKIYLIYDRGREKENEIILAIFTEDELLKEDFNLEKRVISKL